MVDASTGSRSPVGRAHLLLLTALAYVPLLLSAPGRLAGDTKLYLYLDPGRLISDSVWSWDARQLGGWVPHQNVGYLWPSGPFYAFFDWIGCPDWIAQRLWLGTLLLLAGLGVRRLARLLGQPMLVAGSAALLYQLSPYVLPYISRTSALLLPWSLLPWILHSVISFARHGDRRQLGVFGLLVFSTGGLNATALLMIAPAPLIFYIHHVRHRGLRHTLKGLASLGCLALGASAWWIAGLVVQGRYGAAVLSYSEALPSTAATSTSTEVLRGLGYWLFYDRNHVVELTSAAEPYQGNFVVMAAGVGIVVLGLLGLARWPSHVRSPLLLTLAVGVVLAIGAHPFDDPSLLWKLAVDHPTSAPSLALRSSTRAVPLVVLVLALGAARAIEAVVGRSRNRDRGSMSAIIVTGATVMLAVANIPALVGGRLIDPDVSRPRSIPAAWYDAADFLDRRYDEGRTGAVLLVPGIESAAYRWGYTVDPILPGLTKKPLVTRDWLPLGSAPHNDLLYALDDAFQDGRIDSAAVAPVARLLGADTVMIVNSTQYERFGTIRPERAASLLGTTPPGLSKVAEFGAPTVNLDPRPDARDDRDLFPPQPLPEIVLYEVTDPSPNIRTTDSPAIVLGDGQGTVEIAAAGLIDGFSTLLPYAALPEESREDIVAAAPSVIVTDSNRRRAHHWRGSQEVWGATEPASGVVSRPDLFDQRLPVFPNQTIVDQTIIREESIEAVASSYGTELRYWPEYRPSMALDGDPSTAWLTTGRGTALGETLTITADEKLSELQILLPDDAYEARVTRIDVRVDDGSWRGVELTDAALDDPGQPIDLETSGRRIDIRIAETSGADDPPNGASSSSFGFAEVLPVEDRRPEIVRVPDAPESAAGKATFVFTRLVADPFDSWRRDPERELIRQFAVPGDSSFTLSIDARSIGLAEISDSACRDDLLMIDDRPIALRIVSVSGDDAVLEPCAERIGLTSGDHVLMSTARRGGMTFERIVLGATSPSPSSRAVDDFESNRSHRKGTVNACGGGCWLELADGWNTGWAMNVSEGPIGDPVPSIGGRNTWFLSGSSEPIRFSTSWGPQRFIWIGLGISAVAVVVSLLLLTRRRTIRASDDQPSPRVAASNPVVIGIVIGLTVAPIWGVLSLALLLAVRILGRRWSKLANGPWNPTEMIGAGLMAVGFAFLFAQQIRTGAEPGFGWPSVFERSHRVLLTGLLLVLAGSWGAPDRDSVKDS